MPRPESGRQKGRPAKPATLDAVTRAPEPPEHLGLVGLRVWYATWQHCGSWVAPADAHLVETYATLADEVDVLHRALASGSIPRFYMSKTGSIVSHPAVQQLSNLRRALTTSMSQLGLTPSDRARMQAEESAGDIALALEATMAAGRAAREQARR